MTVENEKIPSKNIFKVFYNGYAKMFDFKTRASKYDYWGFVSSNSLYLALAALVIPFCSAGIFLIKIFCIVFFFAVLSLTVRRLHDIGRSGKFLLIGLFLYPSSGLGYISFALLCLFLIWVLFFLFYTLCSGQLEANAYGEPVKEKKSCNIWVNAIIIPCFVLTILVLFSLFVGYSIGNSRI